MSLASSEHRRTGHPFSVSPELVRGHTNGGQQSEQEAKIPSSRLVSSRLRLRPRRAAKDGRCGWAAPTPTQRQRLHSMQCQALQLKLQRPPADQPDYL